MTPHLRLKYAQITSYQEESMRVEIVYAAEQQLFSEQLELQEDATVAQAIERSGLQQAHPEIDWAVNRIGIYGKLVQDTAVLRDKDRIEIYRPLKARKSRG